MFYQKHYSQTCLRHRKSCAAICNTPPQNCPEYTPDFIRLAESYGAKGIRVTEESEIADALTEAKQNQKAPTIIEFIIEQELNVLPIVPPGRPLQHMILEGSQKNA